MEARYDAELSDLVRLGVPIPPVQGASRLPEFQLFRPAGGCFQSSALAPDTLWCSRNAPMSSISRNAIEACGCPWVWKTCLI